MQLDLKPKSIIENFDPDYGAHERSARRRGPEHHWAQPNIDPYYDFDPTTEVIKSTNNPDMTPLGSLNDGTQIWKITHNGVDTHAMHWHMFDVQVINRVGWDGAIRPPDASELGWKDTVRMNLPEDIVVALRPEIPRVPWELPNSIRSLDVTTPDGTTGQFSGLDPTNQPARVTNHTINFGWDASNLTALTARPGVSLSWSDNSANETGFVVQRATQAAPTSWTTVTTLASSPADGEALGRTVTYSDKTTNKNPAYLYRVIATNVVGYLTKYAAPAAGYPHVNVDSDPVTLTAPVTAG